MSLYNIYRPQTFDDVIGQDHITAVLQQQKRDDTFAHAYLLVGPRGTGKTTTARLIAKSLNNISEEVDIASQTYIDIIEIDAASNTGVDDMRDVIEKSRFAPTSGTNKIYIIDEVHMLSKAAFNALLKTLEEPPSHAYFVLATTEVHKVPTTIISRTMRFDFHRISDEDIIQRLEMISSKEDIVAEKEALQLIAKESDGGLRDAINILDQTVVDKKLTREHVAKSLGLVGIQHVEKLVSYLFDRNAKQAITLINTLYQEGVNLEKLIQDMLKIMKGIIFNTLQENNDQNAPLEQSRYIEIANGLMNKEFKTQGNRLFELELWVLDIVGKNGVMMEDRGLVRSSHIKETSHDNVEKNVKKAEKVIQKENKTNPDIVKDALDIFADT